MNATVCVLNLTLKHLKSGWRLDWDLFVFRGLALPQICLVLLKGSVLIRLPGYRRRRDDLCVGG